MRGEARRGEVHACVRAEGEADGEAGDMLSDNGDMYREVEVSDLALDWTGLGTVEGGGG